MLKVLYEDNHLIAVFKPSGVLVQGDKTGDPTLMDEVKYYLKTKYHKTGKVWLGLIHRLDRPVSGIILFAKTSKGASRVSEQFRAHTVEKVYHAVVVGVPLEAAGTLVHWLKKDGASNKTTVYPSDFATAKPLRAGGLPITGANRAELSYEIEKTNGKFSLLKIKLGTGRSHQIRAQLAAMGCPIIGDVKYGSGSAPIASDHHSIALAATSLKFMTATGDEEKSVIIPIPETLIKIF